MPGNYEKDAVYRIILRLLACYVGLPEAVVATLGGEGREARIWREAGIKPDNAYLIENRPSPIARLQREFKDFYCYHGRLARFREVFESTHGVETGTDLLHADLCGTLQTSEQELTKALPLIRLGKARCLAITVADKRRNQALLDPKAVSRKANKLFGNKANTLRSRLIGLHTQLRRRIPNTNADVMKTVCRELGFLISLTNLLAALPGLLPDRMERYIYASNGFRMRTTVLHLADTPVRRWKPERVASTVADLAMSSQFYWVQNDQLIEIKPPDVPVARGPVSTITTGETKNMKTDTQSPRMQEVIDRVMKVSAEAETLFKPVLAVSVLHQKAFVTLSAAIVSLIDVAKTSSAETGALSKVRPLLKQALEIVGAERTVEAAKPTPSQPSKPVEPKKPAKKAAVKAPAKKAATPPPKPVEAKAPVNEVSKTPVIDALIFTALKNLDGKTDCRELSMEHSDALRLYIDRETCGGNEKRCKDAYRKVKKVFHLTRLCPNRSLGCFVARGNGKFRPEMWARLLLDRQAGDERRALSDELALFFGERRGLDVVNAAAKTQFWIHRVS